ncbi:hypothetical protein AZ66_30235 [Paenibacillus sp. E194]|uniref:hypothetical protein n=1 Tax=Paenibacillus sp. E194 TaxID=1458845 RepID=UPI0005C8ED77|nr:hypothetical protein [Paenibacillus sp. E194]KJB84581.1 hypothetical protein AZ66_30235 [Paenibacillus sp. E194]
MKKALVVFGTTVALMASVLAPTTGMAAKSTKATINNVVALSATEQYVKGVLSKQYYNDINSVPKTMFYVKGNFAGTLNLTGTHYDGSGSGRVKNIWGVYAGIIYNMGPQ